MDEANILIVGGAGFVGSNLTHSILSKFKPNSLTIVDNLISSDLINVPMDSNVHFVLGSIADDRVLAGLDKDFDYVFHLACYHGNQSSIADPIADHENNTLTSLKLFDFLTGLKSLRKVVYAAAGCAVAEKTYDAPEATLEDAPVSLFHDSPYSISKLIGEMYGNYYFQRHGLPFVKARFQNVYGPREILGAGNWRGTAHSVWRNVTPTFIWRSLHEQPLQLDNGGNASRDFIYVEDIVEGLIACALKGEPSEAYNLASGTDTTILELANLINDATGSRAEHDLKPARDWDSSGKRFGSTIKSRETIDFSASTDIQEGIRKTVEWTLANKELIKSRILNYMKYLPELKIYE